MRVEECFLDLEMWSSFMSFVKSIGSGAMEWSPSGSEMSEWEVRWVLSQGGIYFYF